MAEEPPARIAALKALAAWAGQPAFSLAAQALADPFPAVRREAIRVIRRIDPEQCLVSLIHMLGDEDASVRRAAAETAGNMGPAALDPVIKALENPRLEDGALLALEFLPVHGAENTLRAYSFKRADQAETYHRLYRQGLPYENQDESVKMLVDSLQAAASRQARRALSGLGLLSDPEAVALALDSLNGQDIEQRASAMEILEGLGEPNIVARILRIWEAAGRAEPVGWEAWLLILLADGDVWIRACAAQAVKAHPTPGLLAALVRMIEIETDGLVREVAQSVLEGGKPVKTLPTLSMMERILFLRRVALLADLGPADLKAVAEVTDEYLFSSNELIAEQGEPGEELFIIVSGQIDVRTNGRQGPGREIARRKPGEVVGEMALLDQQPRMASLVAEGEVRVLRIEQRVFVDLLRTRPEISLGVIRVLSQRLRESAALKPG
jgi:HEAT repeat protein